MSPPSSTPPLRLSAEDRLLAERFFAEPDCPLSPSSDRPISQYSIPRTVSRPGSWADFEFDIDPDVELHCLNALRAISGVFPEGPLQPPADLHAQERTQKRQSLSESTCVGDADSDFKSPKPSIITLSEESSASGSQSTDVELYDGLSDDVASATSEEQSLRRSRRSGFYGTPPTSATPSLSRSTDSGEPSPPIDLSSYSALTRFVFELRNEILQESDGSEPRTISIDCNLLDNPWLVLADELGRDGPPVGGLSLPRGFEPHRLSVVPEVEEEEEQRVERVRRSLSIALAAAAAMRRNKPLPALPLPPSDPAESQVPSPSHPQVMIAPLISLEEARKRFAHPDSLDIACSSRAADAEVPPPPPPARRRSSLQSLRDRFSQLRVKT
ncbi:hypothetical protein DENSPDRAFT_702784 [Dentipellis sp. KUC8613]|nr:hypothetical protein DENSPDRAFT_702784 [Dentipellis sp. KUC8613]